PVSWPASFAPTLARLHGPFATCGLAEDTGACVDEVLSQEAFLEQVYTIEQEREAQFFHCLERTSEGLCLAVFDAPDRVQHVVNDQPLVDALYEHLDGVVGQTLSKLTADDLLLVLSDHGCGPWRRSFDVNAWLIERGYLVMAGDTPDREKSRAYGLGLSGLYLLGPADGLRQELLAVVDPETGEQPLLDVFESSSLYHGPYCDKAPDLVLAYRPGYRTSRASAQGQAGQTIFSTNTSPWQTDHCFHPDHVPGVLLANRELAPGAHLVDLAPTILESLGVPRPDYLEGKSLCV
ncbi:MAG: alkaline phosphatase family protein, partial [Candidatus Eremiobacteraeota bacterium]|nr:alkaline phosphatase family protein [Candidatus Eremiobacteraeota bacterium]